MVLFKIAKTMRERPEKGISLRPKEKIIKYLMENRTPQSIRTVSGAVFIDYKNTYNLVNELHPEVISREKVGNTVLIGLKAEPNQEIYAVEQKRTEEFLSKKPRLKVVKSYIEELNYPFLIAVIFGSHAKNSKVENSDIDLCIISDNEPKISQLREKLGILSLPVEIHAFTTEEFVSMIEKSQNNLGHEIIKSNFILYGIENYYNLISKWMKKE
jgi:predicted nucleotidyltransferase